MKTKQPAYSPDDPILRFRAALEVRRRILVDQQEIVRRQPSAFTTPVIKRGLQQSEIHLALVTRYMKAIYDVVEISPEKRRALLTHLNTFIVRFQRSLNVQRLRLDHARNKHLMFKLKAALARFDDLDVAHPEHTFDLAALF